MDINEIAEILIKDRIGIFEVESVETKSHIIIVESEFKNALDLLRLVKCLGKRAVFIRKRELDETDFADYSAESLCADYTKFDADYEEGNAVNYEWFSEDLKKFRAYTGKTLFTEFLVFDENRIHKQIAYADWFDDFFRAKEEAEEKFKEYENAAATAVKTKELEEKMKFRERETRLLERIGEFATDEKFINLRTQKAKLEYVLAQIPELKEITPLLLKNKISDVAAVIEARKHL